MIGQLRGTLVHKDPPQMVIDVGGVGYEVEAPLSTWSRLPGLNQAVSLRTHLVIREDQHLLFGFATEAERRLFRDLIKVTGVGARTALGVLSGMSVEEFARSVQTRDLTALTKLPGVGRKTAERLVLDLRERMDDYVAGSPSIAAALDGTPQAEVIGALLALGYKPAEARRMTDQSAPGPAGSTAEWLRAALKAAAPQARG